MAKHIKNSSFVEDLKNEEIELIDYSGLMSESFISYALSVIRARALPDIRDGLKPVQRRILHSMDVLKIYQSGGYKKSARIVGDTMGKFHPHGDSGIYTAYINMSQNFKRTEPTIDGHGNFGSIEGDVEAAMRYTEGRLTKFSQEVFLDGNNKNVVAYQDNYDQTEVEPVYLPAKIPYALLNGSEGIAVGMATYIPPHNLSELIDGLIYVLKNEDPTLKGVLKYIKGPDFPTGGIISNQDDIGTIYANGKGIIKIRGTIEFEPAHTDKETKKKIPDALVVTSIPYRMIGEELPKFINKVEELSNEGILSEIVRAENHSVGHDIRIVFYLKKNADIDYITNTLYQKTKLESSYGSSFIFIDNNKPVELPLHEILIRFCEQQKINYTNKFNYELQKNLHQKEIHEGLLRAISIIDIIMEVAKGSKNIKKAKECLMTGNTKDIKFSGVYSEMIASDFNFTELQAEAILKLTISRMVGLEIESIRKEYERLKKEIERLTNILDHKDVLVDEIVKELIKIKKSYGKERKTKLDNLKIEKIEKAKEKVELVALIDNFGYIHTISKTVYDKNKETIDKDFKHIVESDNMSKLVIFTDKGNVHSVKSEDVPGGSLRFKGEPLDNLTNFENSKELILNVLSINNETQGELLIVTSDGFLKRMEVQEINKSRKTIPYIKLNDEQSHVAYVHLIHSKEVILATNDNYIVKLDMSLIEPKKRGARGVTGIKLNPNASVSLVRQIEEDDDKILFKDKEIELKKIKLVSSGKKGTLVK